MKIEYYSRDGEANSLKFRYFCYPDGQYSVEVEQVCLEELSVRICSRMSGFDCIQQIACVVSALRSLNADRITLFVPYLLGARSDRRFGVAKENYLKDVIAPVINSLNIDRIETLDVHSNAALHCVKNLFSIRLTTLAKWVVEQTGPDCTVVCPDKGGVARAKWFAAESRTRHPIVFCEKERDPSTGKILETVVPVDSFEGRDVIVVDDICDGGATFLNLGRKIRERKCGKLYLFVTHGIFSAGFHLLEGAYDKIFCTDSCKKVDHPLVAQYPLFGDMDEI